MLKQVDYHEAMSDSETSPTLSSFGGPPDVQADACLNARHKAAGCRLCAEVCPVEAITLLGPGSSTPPRPSQPHLDPHRCLGCGLCLPACPTDVFTQPDPPETKLAQTVASLPDRALSLVCPLHPVPGLTAAPVTAVVRHKRCLASLSPATLISLSDGGRRPIWLDDTACGDCPIGRVQPAISRVAAAANVLLQAFGCSPAIRTHLDQPGGLNGDPLSLPLIEGDRRQVSRRGFFKTLGVVSRAVTNGSEDRPPRPKGRVPVSERLPQQVPASRQRLLEQLASLGSPGDEDIDTANFPLTGVTIETGACSACRLCARFCPTGALRFVSDDDRFGLSFKPSLCLDCGICAVACPENAVSFDPRLAPAELTGATTRWLVVGQLVACTGCDELTAGQDETGQPRCHLCRLSAGSSSGRTSIADLFTA